MPDPSTPSKNATRQQSKSPLIPSAQATEAALRLLTSFALTNRPSSLARALPESVNISEWHQRQMKIEESEEQDSFIAQESMRIKGAKDVWALLKGGAVQRKAVLPMTPKRKGSKRRSELDHNQEDLPLDVENSATVGENAWPILDWLLMLFEKDETLSEENGLRKPFKMSTRLSANTYVLSSSAFAHITSSNPATAEQFYGSMGGGLPSRRCFLLFRAAKPQA